VLCKFLSTNKKKGETKNSQIHYTSKKSCKYRHLSGLAPATGQQSTNINVNFLVKRILLVEGLNLDQSSSLTLHMRHDLGSTRAEQRHFHQLLGDGDSGVYADSTEASSFLIFFYSL